MTSREKNLIYSTCILCINCR